MILTEILKSQREHSIDGSFVLLSEKAAKERAELETIAEQAPKKTTNTPVALSSVETLIEENATYLGTDVSADAKAKIKMKKQETKEGGAKDAKDKKTRGRKTNNQ